MYVTSYILRCVCPASLSARVVKRQTQHMTACRGEKEGWLSGWGEGRGGVGVSGRLGEGEGKGAKMFWSRDLFFVFTSRALIISPLVTPLLLCPLWSEWHVEWHPAWCARGVQDIAFPIPTKQPFTFLLCHFSDLISKRKTCVWLGAFTSAAALMLLFINSQDCHTAKTNRGTMTKGMN